MKKNFLILALTVVQMTFASVHDQYPFTHLSQEKLFNKVISQTRCVVCQNQTLMDSHAPLAADLRKQIYEHVLKGESEPQVLNYLKQRYGTFILYAPPLQANTLILWGLPCSLLLIGFLTGFLYLRKGHVDDD